MSPDRSPCSTTKPAALAGVGPDEIQAVEWHDCCKPSELISTEALGLTLEGTAEQYIQVLAETWAQQAGLADRTHACGTACVHRENMQQGGTVIKRHFEAG